MNLFLKKSLGQNFLINSDILNKIIECGNITSADCILEVGPGTGNLTEKILDKNPKKLIVVEKDKELSNSIEKKFKMNLRSLNEDILEVRLDKLNYNKLIIFGNLPYNISTQILINWIINDYNFLNIKKLILMFQKEVADRIMGQTNDKNYGRLSIISNWKFNIKREFDIDPSSFYPKPKVQSTLLSLIPKDNFFKIKNPHNLEKITSIFFNQRRKMIKKPLNQIFNNNNYLIEQLKINTNLRPQNLKSEFYYKLAEIYSNLGN